MAKWNQKVAIITDDKMKKEKKRYERGKNQISRFWFHRGEEKETIIVSNGRESGRQVKDTEISFNRSVINIIALEFHPLNN